MTDTITLPREVVKLALDALEWSWGGEPMGTKELAAITALRTHLAAEQPKPEPVRCNPADYCAARHMNLYTAPPEDEALRRDAERYEWAVENAVIETDRFRHDGNDPCSTKHVLDAAIDAAMRREQT